MQQSVWAFLAWFGSLTALLFCDCTRKELMENPYHSTVFFVLQLPLYAVVLFGCYALMSIGWHLFTLSKANNNDVIYLLTFIIQ